MTIGGARLSRRVLAPVALVVALVVGLSAYVVVHADGRDPSVCELFAMASAERLDRDHGSTGPRTVVIGDSYSVGLGLERPDESWPSRLPGRVHVAGFSGSGFAAAPCGAVAYADRAAAAVRGGADLVVVEGGLNDVRSTDEQVRAGFDRLMRELDGLDVLVVGPPAAPDRPAAARHVDVLLAGLAAAADVDYLATTDLDLPYLADGLHLTPAGHQQFGDAVAAAVRGL